MFAGVPRKFYLEELRVRYPNSFIGKAPHTDMARIYGQAKIGFHYIVSTSPFSDMISMRVYEVLAAKRLLIANDLGKDDYGAVGLRNRQELVLYRSTRELFDLAEDPNEQSNLAASDPERVKELAQALDSALAKMRRERVEPSTSHLSSEDLDQLKALGYLQ